MHYHVARDGHQLGRVRETDLKAGLTDGRYLATDLVWCDGMAQWTPLGEVMGASPLPQPTSSSTGTTGANPSPAPAGPAMSRTPAPAFTPAPAPAPRFGSRTALPVAGTAPASGLAMTALISGIVAFLLCGLGGIATLVAIITGHVSLGRINRSAGMVGGRGMALAGLILGYVSILSTISGIAIMASVSLPAFVKVQERGILLAQEAVLKEVHVACRVYAAANSGKYPATLEELVQQGALKAETLEKLNTLKARSWVGEPGFHYHGEGVDDTTPGESPILVSRAESRSGETIVLYHDGRVEQTPAER